MLAEQSTCFSASTRAVIGSSFASKGRRNSLILRQFDLLCILKDNVGSDIPEHAQNSSLRSCLMTGGHAIMQALGKPSG